MNTQRPWKLNRRSDGTLSVFSIFDTIQGEGPFAGVPAVFVRLAGCNLQCPGCDTDYTEATTEMSPDDIHRTIKGLREPWTQAPGRPLPLVVITGGEPLRQNIAPLLLALSGHYRVQVETNGTLEMSHPAIVTGVTFVVSPKTTTLRLQRSLMGAFKYVVDNEHIADDGLPTVTLGGKRPARPPKGYSGPIFIQPMDAGPGLAADALNIRNTKAAIASCQKHGYTLCLQLHKLVGLP